MNLKNAEIKHYDLIVIGGGIQGAGVALDASQRGLSVFICDKGDFAHATSSQSSKLIHGGLRYLENFEFSLVKESLFERKSLLNIAKHSVHPLAFWILKDRHAQRYFWMYRLGLHVYDFLSGKKSIGKHTFFKSIQSGEIFSFLKLDKYKALKYFDARTDDFRLALDVIKSAENLGAVCLNYAEAKIIECPQRNDQASFVVELKNNSKVSKVSSSALVNAGGPWANAILEKSNLDLKSHIKFGKGIHVVFETDKAFEEAVLLEIPNEKRIFFMLPWKGRVLIGTTDTEYTESLDDIKSDTDDVTYLKNAIETYLTPDYLKSLKPVSLMSGVRPLVMKGVSKSSQELSRGYRIEKSTSGMWSILGGKYTVFREIAEKTVDHVCAYLGVEKQSKSASTLISPSPIESWQEFLINNESNVVDVLGIQKEDASSVLERYGDDWKKLKPYFSGINEGDQKWLHPFPYYKAELNYSIEHEFCKTLEDYMMRRTSLFYTADAGLSCVDEILSVFIKMSVLDADEAAGQKETYIRKVSYNKETLAFVFKEGS